MKCAAIAAFPLALLFTPVAGFANDPNEELRQKLFRDYCTGKSLAQSENALLASGDFETPLIFDEPVGRIAIFPYKGETKSSVILLTEVKHRPQCSAGVKGITLNLYKDGRITKSYKR